MTQLAWDWAPREHLSELDLSWAAGIFEGEGHVGVHHFDSGGRTGMNFVAKVTMVSNVPLIFAELFGGSIWLKRGKGNRRTAIEWALWGRPANSFYSAILPYMRDNSKREQVILALQIGETINPKANTRDPAVHAFREQCIEQIKLVRWRKVI